MMSRRLIKHLFVCGVLVVLVLASVASAGVQPRTNTTRLQDLASVFQQKSEAGRGPLYEQLLSSTEPAQRALNENPDIKLMFVDERGRPLCYQMNNFTAAKTISTNKVWPGGGYGFSLSGSGTALTRLAIWDGGGVYTIHQEFQGRVTQIDAPGSTHYHSTHVAGTMIAAGVAALAKGMSYQANLSAYEWTDDAAEMATAAGNGLNISNHSYSWTTGWYLSGDWYWFGDTDVSTTEDYYFGFYSYYSQDWDQIAYNAPYYTIVCAAGNDRDDVGPAPGGGHWVWDNNLGDWVWSTATRDPDGGTAGYDCMSHYAVAKNIVSVGAVQDIPAGYSQPSDVIISDFSSWGPTDDGRIKPDFVANGMSLYSCTNTGTNRYLNLSGTSMSSPNLSGSLNLLVRYYESSHGGTTPRSATMKAVLVQTADEAGASTGPDYKFGWGLMNTLKAANVIAADSAAPFYIREDVLANTQRDTFYLHSGGVLPLRVTVSWTDPPGTPTAPAVDPTTLMLVNDLDVRLTHVQTSTEYFPYVLNPSNPSAHATAGDNIRDNVEQVYIASPPEGDYMVIVKHKGTLVSSQYYSLVASEKMSTAAPDLTPPAVTVIAPNGGETLVSGSNFNVRWTATDAEGVDSVTILLSLDGGFNFTETIAHGEVNDGSYLWFVPVTYSDSCIVRVV
ncbi:MAG: S8 family serine peptidase, partial [Candidatus Eisenbacteria bacterium]